MVLQNFITLEEGVPKRMHFTDHRFEDRVRRDPVTGREGPVRVLVFDVDEEDGQKVARTFSVLSEKLAKALQPWLEGKDYTRRTVIITKRGEGFLTEFEVQGPLR